MPYIYNTLFIANLSNFALRQTNALYTYITYITYIHTIHFLTTSTGEGYIRGNCSCTCSWWHGQWWSITLIMCTIYVTRFPLLVYTIVFPSCPVGVHLHVSLTLFLCHLIIWCLCCFVQFVPLQELYIYIWNMMRKLQHCCIVISVQCTVILWINHKHVFRFTLSAIIIMWPDL